MSAIEKAVLEFAISCILGTIASIAGSIVTDDPNVAVIGTVLTAIYGMGQARVLARWEKQEDAQ